MNKGQRMEVRQRGRGNTSSGVAPQDMIFIPVPASYLPWQDFLFFREVFVMFLFTKLWRRRADVNFILKENKS